MPPGGPGTRPLLTPLSTGTPGQVRVTAHQRAPPAPAGGPAGRRGRVQSRAVAAAAAPPVLVVGGCGRQPPAPAPARCESAQAGVVAAGVPTRHEGPLEQETPGHLIPRAKSALRLPWPLRTKINTAKMGDVA